MVKTITPFSTRAKEGATDSPLGDFVTVDQTITSTANAGFFDKNTGKFEGVLGSDKLFTIDATHEATPNTGVVLSPQATPQYIDMTGFSDLFIAIKPSNGGNVAITAIMGPNDISFANLTPINPAITLKSSTLQGANPTLDNIIVDSAESLTVDVWNIFPIYGRLKDQKLLQFSITNNSGGESDIDFAYMRVV